MILCLGPTPALQRVMRFERWQPNAVIRARETADGVAGKAVNVAKVLHTLGEPVLVTGFLGGESGRRLEADLERRGLPQAWVRVDAPTRQCITVLDDATGAVTELVEESRPVPASAYDQLEKVVRSHLLHCRALVIAGTLTPGAPRDFYTRCARQARERLIPTVVDTQRDALRAALAGQPTVVKPNRAELEALLERPLPDDAALVEAMQTLQTQGAEVVLVSAGAGAVWLLENGRLWRARPPRVAAVNPIGSGDALTAALVARRLRGDDWPEACRWGVAAGAANALTLLPGEVEVETVRQLHRQVAIELAPWPQPSAR